MIKIKTSERGLLDEQRPPAARVRIIHGIIVLAQLAFIGSLYFWYVKANHSQVSISTASLAGSAAGKPHEGSARSSPTAILIHNPTGVRISPIKHRPSTMVPPSPPATPFRPVSAAEPESEALAQNRRSPRRTEPARDPEQVLLANGLKRASSIFVLDDEAAAERMIDQIQVTLKQLQPAAAWLERLDHARSELDEMRKSRHDAWIEAERLSLVLRQTPRPGNNIEFAQRQQIVQAEFYQRALVNHLDTLIRDATRSMPQPAQVRQWETTKSTKSSALRDEVSQLRDLVNKINTNYEKLNGSDEVVGAIRAIPHTRIGPSNRFSSVVKSLIQFEKSDWLR